MDSEFMDQSWVRLLAILIRMRGLLEMWDHLSEEDRKQQLDLVMHDYASTITPAMPANWRAIAAGTISETEEEQRQ